MTRSLIQPESGEVWTVDALVLDIFRGKLVWRLEAADCAGQHGDCPCCEGIRDTAQEAHERDIAREA